MDSKAMYTIVRDVLKDTSKPLLDNTSELGDYLDFMLVTASDLLKRRGIIQGSK